MPPTAPPQTEPAPLHGWELVWAALIIALCGCTPAQEPVVAPPVPLRLTTCLPAKQPPRPPPPPRKDGQLVAYAGALVNALDYANNALLDCRRRLDERNTVPDTPKEKFNGLQLR